MIVPSSGQRSLGSTTNLLTTEMNLPKENAQFGKWILWHYTPLKSFRSPKTFSPQALSPKPLCISQPQIDNLIILDMFKSILILQIIRYHLHLCCTFLMNQYTFAFSYLSSVLQYFNYCEGNQILATLHQHAILYHTQTGISESTESDYRQCVVIHTVGLAQNGCSFQCSVHRLALCSWKSVIIEQPTIWLIPS